MTRPPLSSSERAGHGEQRVGADQRPVGELDPEPVGRVAAAAGAVGRSAASPNPAEISGA